MIHVDCPSCNAPYELDERRLPKGGMKMRCPKCGTSFPVTPQGTTDAAPAPKGPPAPGLAPAGRTPPAPASPRAPAAPKPPAPPRSDDLDGIDLPTPKRSGRPVDDLELDLPVPKRVARPASKSQEVFDVPVPRGAGLMLEGLDELDRPAPKPAVRWPATPKGPPVAEQPAAPIVDLPVRKVAPGAQPDRPIPTPAPAFAEPDRPIPTPGAAAGSSGKLDPLDDLVLDLPAPLVADLPARRRGGALDELDLPTPRIADLPAPRRLGVPAARAADIPSAQRHAFGELLDAPPPRDVTPRPPEADPFDLPETFPPPRISAHAPPVGLGLEVPPPRPMAPEIDEALALGKGAAVATSSVRTSATSAANAPRAKRTAFRPPRAPRSAVAIAAVLALLGCTGAALHFTRYGLFGIYLLEELLPSAGSEAEAERVIERAEARAASDTYEDARAALRELAAARRTAGLNRSLLVRSLVHEALFEARFGADAASAARAARIRARLDDRAALVPGMAVARAADELRRGAATASIAEARRASPGDAYVELLAGESALRRGAGEEAREAFRAALSHGAGGRALWGLARAAILLDDRAAEAAVDATLAASPDHVSAIAAKAELTLARGRVDEAIALARRAAGLDASPTAPPIGAPRERAAAFAALGRAEEARSHRGSAREAYERSLALDSMRADALVGVGRVLLREGQPSAALGRYESAIEVLGHEGGAAAPAALVREAKLGRAEALLRAERAADARAALDALATERPRDADVALWRGRALAALGQSEPAVTELRRAVALAPDRFEPYMALAQHFFASDEPSKAAEALRSGREHVEPTAEMHRMLGESLLERDELSAAEDELRRALALDSEDRDALFSLGVVARRSGRLDLAERMFDRLASLDAGYPRLYRERASIYEARGQSERAIEALSRALARTPGEPELQLRLAAAQVSARQFDRADATLAPLLATASPPAMAFYHHARVAFARGDLDQAIERFRRAIAIDHERPEFHVHLAWACLERGNLAGAVEGVTNALRLDEANGDAYWIRAKLAVRAGRANDAVGDAERALESNPARFEAYAVMGDAYEQLGRSRDAVKAFEEAIEHDPRVGEWWYKLAKLHLGSSDRDDALAAVSRAVELGDAQRPPPPWLAEAHRLKAETHRLRRERPLAERHYQRYLELAPPTDAGVADAQRRLRDLQRGR